MDSAPAAAATQSFPFGLKVVFGANLLFADDEAWSQGALEVLETAGVKTFDTLHKFGPGEELIGKRALSSRFAVDTKYPVGISPEFTGTKENVIDTAIASLAALKTDQVDVYYLHLPNPNTPVEETLEGINELYKSGRFRRFGLTNFRPDEVREVLRVCREKNYVLPSVYQGNYSAVARKSEAELFPLLRENNMVFYAYSPVAGGFLTKTREAVVSASLGRWDPGSLLGKMYQGLYNRPALLDALDEWQSIAAGTGVSAAELAYRWVAFHSALRPGSGDAIIVGASRVQQLKDTIAALKKGPLPAGIAEKVDGIWQRVKLDAPFDNYNPN